MFGWPEYTSTQTKKRFNLGFFFLNDMVVHVSINVAKKKLKFFFWPFATSVISIQEIMAETKLIRH